MSAAIAKNPGSHSFGREALVGAPSGAKANAAGMARGKEDG